MTKYYISVRLDTGTFFDIGPIEDYLDNVKTTIKLMGRDGVFEHSLKLYHPPHRIHSISWREVHRSI